MQLKERYYRYLTKTCFLENTALILSLYMHIFMQTKQKWVLPLKYIRVTHLNRSLDDFLEDGGFGG